MQNVVEIIILFVLFPTLSSKYVWQLSEKTSFYQLLYQLMCLGGRHFQEIRFLRLLELWGLLFIKFGKFSNEHRFHEQIAFVVRCLFEGSAD